MRIIEITDIFNPLKVWVIKITKCNHYYVNQKIAGKLFYSKFQKMTKRQLQDIDLEVS